jgi:glycosyltransferase involved in cell wall biosynthesis
MSSDRPLNVLILPSWYPTARYPVGGIFCQEHARALNSLPAISVLVLFIDRAPLREWLRSRSKGAALREESGVKVYRAQMPRIPVIWPFLYAPWAFFSVRRVSRRHGFKPDIVHAHVALPAGLAGALLKRLLGVPLVITEHTSPFSLLMRNRVAAFATRVALLAADRVIAVSKSLRTEILAYPELRRHVDIVPNVVDVSAFASERAPRASHFRLLFVGEMETRRKGVDYLLRAMSLLRERGLDVCLDIMGGGRHKEMYKDMAAKLGLAAVCRFHGAVPHRQIASLMAGANLFVLPSLAETFGVVLVEAMAAGLPVVATRCGGPEEVVTPDVGVLVDPADPQALADAIADVLGRLDDFPQEHLRRAAEERYGQESVATRTLTLYREVVGS